MVGSPFLERWVRSGVIEKGKKVVCGAWGWCCLIARGSASFSDLTTAICCGCDDDAFQNIREDCAIVLSHLKIITSLDVELLFLWHRFRKTN